MTNDGFLLFAQAPGPEQIGFAAGFIIGFLIGFAFVFAVMMLIGTALLRFAVQIVCKFELPFWTAMLYCFVCQIINFVIGFTIGFAGGIVMGPAAAEPGTIPFFAVQICSFFSSFVTATTVFGLLIKDPYGRPIGLYKGFLVTLFQFVIVMVIVACIVALAFGIIMSMKAI